MARFNRWTGTLFVEGTDLRRKYMKMSVLINLSATWDIKFTESHEDEGIEYYEMIVYYQKNETERHLMINEDEYLQIQKIIGGPL